MKNTSTRQLVFAALCAALGLVLPMAFHAIPNAGGIFLPMHIPVLLCGFLCGGGWGLACGALVPVLSHLLSAMPPAMILPGMVCELAVYGLVTGLLFRLIKTKNRLANIYISLLGAMVCGRVVSGLANGLLFRAGQYTFAAWIAASFVTALPGIVIQLLLLPALVYALQRVKVLPQTT